MSRAAQAARAALTLRNADTQKRQKLRRAVTFIRKGQELPPTSLPLVPEARTALVKVPVTQEEKQLLAARAAGEGRSVAEYVRVRLAASPPDLAPSESARHVEPLSIAFTMRDEAA